jgi:hypothetical protein
MQNLHYGFMMLLMLLSPAIQPASPAAAAVSIGIGLPNVTIGVNLPVFPQLVRVPGYPVYYAPRMDANYFFYDGMYWVFQGDTWYASSWYNGPWGFVDPESVPLYVLRIPVSYYRQPPVYFRGWRSNAPPRWGQHWGHEWEQHRNGWDNWKRSSSPAPAPLPVYQKKYSGERYPQVEQQHALRNKNYRYQPKDSVVREHLQPGRDIKAPVQDRRQESPAGTKPKQPDVQRPAPLQKGAPAGPHTQPPQQGGEQVHKMNPAPVQPQQRPPAVHEQKQPDVKRPAPLQKGAPASPHTQPPQQGGEQVHKMNPVPVQPQQRPPAVHEQKQQPGAVQQHEQQVPRPQGQEQRPQEPNRDHGQGQNKDDDRGRGRDK